MNPGIWSSLLQKLPAQWKAEALALPGYDDKPFDKPYTAKELARQLYPQIQDSKNCILVAWSLGGLVALDLMDFLEKQVRQIVLVASSPCFVRRDDWPLGVEPDIFNHFYSQLARDYHKTLKRFIALQLMGSPTANQDKREIMANLREYSASDINVRVLQDGLTLLQQTDYRHKIARYHKHLCFISGQRDTLVNVKSVERLCREYNLPHHIIPAAGHAPFISNSAEFIRCLIEVTG